MTTPLVAPRVDVLLDGAPAAVAPMGGIVSLDALRVPYAAASVALPLTPDTLLGDLDPRADHREIINAGNGGHWDSAVWVPDAPRLFDLGLRSRVVDYAAKTVTLELAGDEALLTDYAVLVEDNGARAHEASLRAVCDYVLGKIGASLAPGGPDADATAYWSATNLISNPSFEVDVAGWLNGTNAEGLARNADKGAPGAGSFNAHWHQISNGFTSIDGPLTAIKEGSYYTVKGQLSLVQGTGGTGTLLLRFKNAAGVILLDVVPPYSPVGGGWTPVEYTTRAPVGSTHASIHVVHDGPGGRFPCVDAVSLTEGAAVPYFDGSTPADAHYTYSWSGPVNNSPSLRTPIVDRPPDLYVWKPGVTAWDFLAPFLSSASLRLFCDELRVWRLIDPANYQVPGFVVVSPLNTTDSDDTISRADPDVFATGVVCNYIWEDTQGTTMTATDAAGTPEKVVVFTYRRPYPGPGAAQAILNRRSGTGRTQDVTALADWRAQPGMTASISMPLAPDLLGKVQSLAWALDDTSLMNVGTRGLIDIPEDSWLAVPPAETWTDPPASSWIDW